MSGLHVYELRDDVDKYPGFLQGFERDDSDPGGWEELMSVRTIRQGDRPFGSDYKPVLLEFNDEGRKKKGVGDICLSLKPFIIFSASARKVLSGLLEPVGEFVAVDAPINGFIGYRLLHRLADCVDLDHSSYSETEEGKVLVRKPAFYRSKVLDQNIFAIPESPTGLFVSGEFKAAVESAKLKGFDFSREVRLT